MCCMYIDFAFANHESTLQHGRQNQLIYNIFSSTILIMSEIPQKANIL